MMAEEIVLTADEKARFDAWLTQEIHRENEKLLGCPSYNMMCAVYAQRCEAMSITRAWLNSQEYLG